VVKVKNMKTEFLIILVLTIVGIAVADTYWEDKQLRMDGGNITNATRFNGTIGEFEILKGILNYSYINNTPTDSDTTYNSDESYIYETANVFYFNETMMNATIEVLSDIDTDTNTWNTSQEMIDAVNGTGLDLSSAFDYNWSQITNIPADISDGDDDTTYTASDFDIKDLSGSDDWRIYYTDGDGIQDLTFGGDSDKYLMSNGEGALSWETPTDTNTWNTSEQMLASVNAKTLNLTSVNTTGNVSFNGLHIDKFNSTHYRIWGD